MKTTILAAAIGLFSVVATPALAASDHDHHSHDMGKMSASTAMTEGTVKKVDKAGGKVTLAHGPIENVGMPAMTMAFPVKKGTNLDQVKVGDKVLFRAEPVNGNLTVVALEPAK